MIRLPDYSTSVALNDVRQKMRADLIDIGETTKISYLRISRRDLEALESVGLEINLDQIETLGNHTFSFLGECVLLYIMQPSSRGFENAKLPKFHVANCSTWDRMKASGRKNRYVAVRRTDGVFVLDITGQDGRTRREEHRLEVCKNCLDKIAWEGYSFDDMTQGVRSSIFRRFSLANFFEKQKATLIKEKPRWTPETMPSANYTDDFDAVSSAARRAADWKCRKCRRSFTKAFERRFLHTHHLDGVKGNNSFENLTVLCLGCHAEEPDHHHMKRLPDYEKFIKLYGSPSVP
jgi:hypothetical protein